MAADEPALVMAVARFREWAEAGAPDTANMGHGAEWESNYPDWQSLYVAVTEQLGRPDEVDGSVADALLYALARDNEDEIIVDQLVGIPYLFARLLPQASAHPDRHVRWQMASRLPEALGSEASEWLLRLAHDEDEYVRRRAAAAMTELERQ